MVTALLINNVIVLSVQGEVASSGFDWDIIYAWSGLMSRWQDSCGFGERVSLNFQHTAKPPDSVVRLGAIVIHKDTPITAVAKDGPA